MTVYHRCPFCHRVFEIGATDYRPMKQHIRYKHAEKKQELPVTT